MKHLVLFLLSLLLATTAVAKPRVSPNPTTDSYTVTVTFADGDTAPSDPIPVGGQCIVSSWVRGGSETVTVYQTTGVSGTAPVTPGTSVAIMTTTTTGPTELTFGQPYLYAQSDGASGGGILTIKCSNAQVSSTGGGGSGLLGWPNFSTIGGTGRPTQAIVIDSLAFSTKLSGQGRDDDGSTWDGSCTANATTDQPCTVSSDSIAGLSIAIDGATAAFGVEIDWDADADAQAAFFCRDSSTYAHQIGTANDTAISQDGDYVALVLRDDSSDTYRVMSSFAQTAVFDCVNRTGNLQVAGELSYPTATADDMMIFLMDSVHLSPYGSRWTAQEVLTAAWEDQYPEMLGVTNLIPNGYMETTCTDGDPLTLSGGGGFGVRAGSDTAPVNRPTVGQGCEWTASGDTDARTVATAAIDAEPGAYYVGSITLGAGGVALNQRSLVLRIRDSLGANVPNAKFWIGGQPTGVGAEAADTIDATGVATPGEYQMRERNCYGGCIVKFAFQVPADSTTFDLQLAQTDVATQYTVYIDELWVRKKLYQDLERHHIIADGRAKLQLFTDSRGLATRYENLQQSFDYLLGETTESGHTRAEGSLRPDLHLTSTVTASTYAQSGHRLGDYVGENDGFERYSGAASTFPQLGPLINNDTSYCVAYFGINDLTAGARPSYASLASDTEANRHLYWGDQLRGFEIEAEKNGCIPIAIMEPVVRGDSTTTTCTNTAGSASNCANWHKEAWKNILHNGLP